MEKISKKERRARNRARREQEQKRKQRALRYQRFAKLTIGVIGAIAIFGGVVWLIGQRQFLPPVDPVGHIEVSPPSHILAEPMDIRVFKHMIEHADGSGPPGVIITYNCDDFDCDSNLIARLEEIVRKNPDRLYLAPFPNQDAMIVVTTLGRQEILVEIDEEKILSFL